MARISDIVELPQGYTLTELERLAKIAARTVDYGCFIDRCDTAWSAMVERLYADPDEPITPRALLWIARSALHVEYREQQHDHGWDARRGGMPKFHKYWYRPVTTFEEQLIERHAFAEIWPQLTPAEQRAVVALAIYEDQQVARQAYPNKNFGANLKFARRRFLRLWHEGEEPSKKWGYDHPGGKPPDVSDRPRGPGGSFLPVLELPEPESGADEVAIING